MLLRIDFLPCPFNELWKGADVRMDGRDKTEARIDLNYRVQLTDWSGPWSLRAFVDTVRKLVQNAPDLDIRWDVEDELLDHRITIVSPIRWPHVTLSAAIDALSTKVDPLIEQARALLLSDAERNTLVTFFDFPPAVSTACEQYLVYFVQFLKDLGIEANAALKHDARRVLFSVTAQDESEGLDRIRQALELYLQLPSAPEFKREASRYPDIAVRQLQANVLHLQSQLALAGAILQAKHAQAEALELSNFRYSQILANSQHVGKLMLSPDPEDSRDKESLIQGVLSVTPLEGKGITIELPELLRRLKRRIGWDNG